uniref:hypothetical protein n=1 Tax=Paractinoplanes polyasparticus TaxID=2856853 RepID=UPI001C8603F3|nr:hypothetical protein [Actinoplanes polyasparticus]
MKPANILLDAEQARPLLAAVVARPPQKPRRRPTSDTVVAPADTVAAPTVEQSPVGPTATAHTVLLPLKARSRTAWIAAGVVGVLPLAGGIAWATGRNGRTIMNKSIDSVGADLPCLCADATLVSYGNRNVSTDTYERVSRTP